MKNKNKTKKNVTEQREKERQRKVGGRKGEIEIKNKMGKRK